MARDCHNIRSLTALELHEIQQEQELGLPRSKEVKVEEPMEVVDVEIDPPLRHTTLLTRFALHSKFLSDGEDHREIIFYTTCSVKDRDCSLIIDGGSCKERDFYRGGSKVGVVYGKFGRAIQVEVVG